MSHDSFRHPSVFFKIHIYTLNTTDDNLIYSSKSMNLDLQ